MDVIREALNYPSSGGHGAKAVVRGSIPSVIAGLLIWVLLLADMGQTAADAGSSSLLFGILCLLGILFLIGIVVARGYYVSSLSAVSGPVEDAPPFRVLEVLVNGVIALLIMVAYLLPGSLLCALGYYAGELSDTGSSGVVIETVGALLFLFGLFALLGAFYLLPAATTLFAAYASVRKAFDRSKLMTCALSEEYAFGWTFAVAVQLVLVPLAVLFCGILIGFFVLFYVRVSAHYVYARSVTNTLDGSG